MASGGLGTGRTTSGSFGTSPEPSTPPPLLPRVLFLLARSVLTSTIRGRRSYIYVPLGGAKRPLLSTLVVFTFVALWHDLSFTLLTWGWLVSLVVLPEVIASHLFPREKYGGKRWYRHAVALGGLGNVLGMTSVNLVGFVIGVEGMWSVLRGIWGSWHGEWKRTLRPCKRLACLRLG